MSEVHFRLSPGHYACGVGNRWGSQDITSTIHKLAVTCEGCKATHPFKAARQLIPEVQGGPYRG